MDIITRNDNRWELLKQCPVLRESGLVKDIDSEYVGKEDFLPIIGSKISKKAYFREIMRIYKNGTRTNIITESGEYETKLEFAEVEERVKGFMYKCMNTCYINLCKIDAMKQDSMTVIFSNGEKFSLGRNNYIKLKQVYNLYLLNPNAKPQK